jgi:hypothetical protein
MDWSSVFASAIKMGLPNKIQHVEVQLCAHKQGMEVIAIIDGHDGHVTIYFDDIEEAISKLLAFC